MKFLGCVIRVILLALLVVAAFPTTARAAASKRTWVSAVGDDVNPCTRTAPCRTFAGAFAQTLPAGDINVIDSGGYAPLTITKAITIDGAGSLAAISNSGANGIVIQATTTDVVTLRHLVISGGGAGAIGIKIVSAAKVNIEDCEIAAQGTGISIANTSGLVVVNLRNTIVRDNIGDAFLAQSTGPGIARGTLSGSTFTGNGAGIHVAGANSSFVVHASTITSNTGDGAVVDQASSGMVLTQTTVALNGTGINAGTGGATPTIRLGQCTVTGNTNGIAGSGSVVGFYNNVIAGNTGSNTITQSFQAQ